MVSFLVFFEKTNKLYHHNLKTGDLKQEYTPFFFFLDEKTYYNLVMHWHNATVKFPTFMMLFPVVIEFSKCIGGKRI